MVSISIHRAGDPFYAGPLSRISLGPPVFHVFEPEVLDRDATLAGLRKARRAAATM